MSIDPSLNPIGPVEGPSYVPPPTEDHADAHDPTASTISQSMAEAIMVSFLMGYPILPEPNSEGSYTAESIAALTASEFARIGSDLWDHYLDHLAEEKERIAEYLASSSYRQWVENHTLEGKVHAELSTPIDIQSPVRNATQYNQFLVSQGVSPEIVQDEMRRLTSIGLWSDLIDGVSNYVGSQRNENPAAGLFVMASFAITATYIGDYANIVDVASTDMVTVNPIQDSVSQVLPLATQFQEQLTMAINLFAIGLINFSNAEAILRSQQNNGEPPTNWESAVAFARNILEKVEGNTVNAFLMSLLIHHTENLGSTQEERETQLSRLVVMAKAVMLSVAIAALLKAATPDLRLTGEIFRSTLSGPLIAQSEDDQRLVDELSPLARYYQYLRDEGMVVEEDWENLMEALGAFFEGNPSTADMFNPSFIYASITGHLFGTDIEG